MKIPNPNNTNPKQITIFKCSKFLNSWGFGNLSLFGAWDLGFGIWGFTY